MREVTKTITYLIEDDDAEWFGVDENGKPFGYLREPDRLEHKFSSLDISLLDVTVKNWQDTLTRLDPPELDWSKVEPGTEVYDTVKAYYGEFIAYSKEHVLYWYGDSVLSMPPHHGSIKK